jgi:transcription elongation factor Elf1
MGYTINNAVLDVVYECPKCGHCGSVEIEGEEYVGNMFGLYSVSCEECGYSMYADEEAEDYEGEDEDDDDEE